MASGFATACNECGRFLVVYVPKAMIFEALGGPPGVTIDGARRTDKRSEADGEVDSLQEYAEAHGASFVDAREPLHCPHCGKALALDELFRPGANVFEMCAEEKDYRELCEALRNLEPAQQRAQQRAQQQAASTWGTGWVGADVMHA